MKGVQCYELFGGIALKIHTFSYIYITHKTIMHLPYIYISANASTQYMHTQEENFETLIFSIAIIHVTCAHDINLVDRHIPVSVS